MKDNRKRLVVRGDASKWLSRNPSNLKLVITSLPDMEEVDLDFQGWVRFIKKVCYQIHQSLNPSGVVVFYQTSRKYKGGLIDKRHIIQSVFESYDYKLLMSKIVLKQKPGTISLFRPSYTNLFAFTRKGKANKGNWPDVIEAGTMLYDNAMGYNACKLAIEMFAKPGDVIVDPFCGKGSVLKIANDMGYDSIGVDIDPKQVKAAKALK